MPTATRASTRPTQHPEPPAHPTDNPSHSGTPYADPGDNPYPPPSSQTGNPSRSGTPYSNPGDRGCHSSHRRLTSTTPATVATRPTTSRHSADPTNSLSHPPEGDAGGNAPATRQAKRSRTKQRKRPRPRLRGTRVAYRFRGRYWVRTSDLFGVKADSPYQRTRRCTPTPAGSAFSTDCKLRQSHSTLPFRCP
jgi:hypothetical protein